MRTTHFIGKTGKTIPNQVVEYHFDYTIFKSYDIVIVKQCYDKDGNEVTYLDSNYWDYSNTTGTYRNKFLGENKAETQKKIIKGEYVLKNLN
jgi:hypothetical protein